MRTTSPAQTRMIVNTGPILLLTRFSSAGEGLPRSFRLWEYELEERARPEDGDLEGRAR